MNRGLLKTEPSTYSYADLVRDRRTTWDGVSNPVALRHLGAMRKGDEAFIYHTGSEKAVVGVARVRDAYPDPKLGDTMRAMLLAGLAWRVLLAAPVFAQTVDLRVREESGTEPVVGAIVRLAGSAGASTRGLTDQVGRVVLRAPNPGSYRIRIDRIGFIGLTTDPVTLDSGQTLRLTIPMPSRRVQLPTLEARGRSRCDPRAQGGALATALWEEVEKALTANVITQTDSLVPLHLRRFVRELDRERKPLRSWVETSRIVRGAPFGSLPPDTLMLAGFVRDIGEMTEFAAPDAGLLLSDAFVLTHCFRAVPGAGDQVGLAFQPVKRRRVPDVEGTLWVDRGTSELRFLEYAYTGLQGVMRSAGLGGRIDFSRLPSGAWIVSHWHIRMPRVEMETVQLNRGERDIVDVVGYADRGGRAEVAGDTTGLIHRALVQGRVYDSVGRRGLERARVWVDGTTDTMRTDSAGRFDFVVDASGDQTISVRHAKLGLLGEPTSRSVLLSLGDTTRIDFGAPSLETFVSAFCPNANPPGTASILGLAMWGDGTPAPEWEVRVMRRVGSGNDSAAAVMNGKRNTNVSVGVRPSRPGRNGLYGLCGIPAKGTVQLIGAVGRLTQIEITIPVFEESRWVDLRQWGSADTNQVASFVSVAPGDESLSALGPSTLTGRVYDSTTGAGLAGAVVRLLGTRDSAVADDTGAFTLSSGASGSRVVTAAHPTMGTLLGEFSREEELFRGDTTVVSFPVIPLDAIVHRHCGDAPKGRSGLLGIARDAAGTPRENIGVVVTWLTTRGWREERRSSTAGGLFVFCDLPARQDLHARMQAGDGRAAWTVKLEPATYHWTDLHATTSP
jgi:hypothetical protein